MINAFPSAFSTPAIVPAIGISSKIKIEAMMFGMGSGFINDPSIALYFVPFLSSALNVLDVVNGNVNFANMGISIGMNIFVAVICTFVIAKMMNSERIVFGK